MIVARAPFRLSFAGGGTDLAAYYTSFGGLVVSTAINRYLYVIVTEGKPSAPVHLISSDTGHYLQGHLGSSADISGATQLPWAVLDHFGIRSGIDLFLASQVPAGTGLGSSSALTVALIHALSAYVGHPVSPLAAAELASSIEIDRLGAPIGLQDQYGCSLGGMNEIAFTAEGVSARPIRLAEATRAALERRLMLFFTGIRRDAGSILIHQQQASEDREPQTMASLHAIKSYARQMIDVLESGDLDSFGEILHESWLQKQQVTRGISNAFIDHCYESARQAGARGGKIAGAGGGGFLLLDCPPEHQDGVTSTLVSLGLQPFSFALETAPAGLVTGTAIREER